MRHKLITVIEDVSCEFFNDLQNKGYVAEEYVLYKSYVKSRINNTITGAFHQVKYDGKTLYSIASHSGWRYHKYSKVKQYGRTKIRIMYLLTDEGTKFVQDYAFIQKLQKGGAS